MLNRAWHDEHRLDPKASMDERLAWHVEHAKLCGCRDMPQSIKDELAARGLEQPERRR